MPVPQVVIVGRPNVGKSSLLNWLAGKRIAIVDPTAGVTRDRLAYLMNVSGRYFEVVDTGGMGIVDVDNLSDDVTQQIDAAIDSADVILFVVDTQTGLLPLDNLVAERLRYVDVPVVLVANKADSSHIDSQADEFYRLGRGKLVRTSTTQNRGHDELLDVIIDRLPPDTEPPPDETVMKVAIVGRRNVGKSTFVNTLAKAKRMITSEIPGTTRDSVDVRFEMDGKVFMAIDTPGLTRTKSVKTDLEFYSSHRAQRSIRRADVVLLFLDAGERISKLDKQLAQYISDQHKPCIFVVNKWDLYARTMVTEKWVAYLYDSLRTMRYVPIAFITGQSGKNVKALINHAQMLFRQARERVTTGKLNRVLRMALDQNPPPMEGKRRPKIFYGTQVATEPPTLILFCNEPRLFSDNYKRYLLGVLRDELPFGEVPIKLYLRRREQGDTRDEVEKETGHEEPEAEESGSTVRNKR